MLLLHGLFGSGGNLGALSRQLAGCLYRLQLDLPNSRAFAMAARPDLPAMAEA